MLLPANLAYEPKYIYIYCHSPILTNSSAISSFPDVGSLSYALHVQRCCCSNRLSSPHPLHFETFAHASGEKGQMGLQRFPIPLPSLPDTDWLAPHTLLGSSH